MTKTAAVQLSDIAFSYDNHKQSKTFYCNHWEVAENDHVFLHGDSGSGKSTLLNLLSGVLTPRKGSITLLETDIAKLSLAKRDKFRAQNLGIVFQQFNLIPYLTVMQNVQLAAYFAKSKSDTKASVDEMLSFLQLPNELINKPVNALSVGQQQRVAIMRAFINQPKLMLIDEPTSALDASARDGFMALLLSLCERHNSTLIFVSHDPALRSHFSEHVPLADICHWQTAKESV
jgi:putative ABC transport system ATP-binding protein